MTPILHSLWHGAADALGLMGRLVGYTLIWAYRIVLKPLFPATCRFEPSCSEYALQAVRCHGLIVGAWLAAKRLGRCNPWGPWGFDPVPDHHIRSSVHSCTGHHPSHLSHAERPLDLERARRAR